MNNLLTKGGLSPLSDNHMYREFNVIPMHCHVLITDKFQHITNRTKVIDSHRFIHGRVMKELSLKQKASVPLFVIGSIQ